MTRGGYAGWCFGQHVEKLVVAVLAYRQRLGAREILERIKAGELDVPPEVQAYFGIVMLPSQQRWRIGSLSQLRLYLRRRGQAMPPDALILFRAVAALLPKLRIRGLLRLVSSSDSAQG